MFRFHKSGGGQAEVGDNNPLPTTGTVTGIGSVTETAPATDTASSGLNGRLQRIAQRITSLLSIITAPTAIYNGKTTVTTAGTRVALASSQAIKGCVRIKALAANTGIIYVGNSSVSSSNGFALAAGEECVLDVDNLATVNLDASANGQIATYIASN